MQFLAVPFGADDITGDSAFYATDQEGENPPATEDSTFEELLAAWQKLDPEENRSPEETEQPVGFWLMKEEHLKIAALAFEASEGGSDSTVYACNRSAKAICSAMAVKTVLQPGYGIKGEG